MLHFLLRTSVLAGAVAGHPIRRFPDAEFGVSAHSDRPRTGSAVFVVSIVLLSVLAFAVLVAVTTCLVVTRRRRRALVGQEDDNQAYLELNLEEQELYFQSKEYLEANPYYRGELTLSQNLSIQEKGIRAWEFVKDAMLTSNDLLIVNKFELNFFKNFECSTLTNLPIPTANDVYYFESKIYSLPDPDSTLISIGMGVKPYPWFRLPGRHMHSISYDSDGYRRHNQPFEFKNDPPFPKLIEGDVVGIGYRVNSGTVFFTRNGKKLSELKIGGHIKNFKIPQHGQLYPIIGANNLCSVHVNIGQLGYVFIEGNVRKWRFAPLEGNGPAPPAYQKFNADILLERSEIDEDNDLADRINDFPPDFWDVNAGRSEDLLELGKFSYNAYSDASDDERITMNSLIPHEPPGYDSDGLSADSDEQEPLLLHSRLEPETEENVANHESEGPEPAIDSSAERPESPLHGFATNLQRKHPEAENMNTNAGSGENPAIDQLGNRTTDPALEDQAVENQMKDPTLESQTKVHTNVEDRTTDSENFGEQSGGLRDSSGTHTEGRTQNRAVGNDTPQE